METTQKNKLQIFIFRSRNQQFKYWGQEEAKWCEKYKDYFTIIDDGEGQIEHNIFKVMKISDFKNPLYLDNKTLHQGVGLLNIANNLDQFDYQYIGFVHMDMFPFYCNYRYYENNFELGYPIMQGQLLDFQQIINEIENSDEEFFSSFSLMKALIAFSWHIQDFNILFDLKDTIWEFLIKRFNLFDLLKLNEEQLQNLKASIACSFLAKKEYWKKLQLFIDNLDQLYDEEKYGHIVTCKCDRNIIISQLLQAYVELTILDYVTQKGIQTKLIPICHFN